MSPLIPFESLASSGGVLVDLGSVASFFTGRGTGYLQTPAGHSYQKAGPLSRLTGSNVVEAMLRDGSLYFREPLRLLELMIVHETLVLDAVALERGYGQQILEDPNAQKLLQSAPFSLCVIPDEVRSKAGEEIARTGQNFRDLLCDFSPGDKAVHDLLFGSGKYSFADSTDSAYRAFYYLALAQSSGLPLVISEGKQRILEQLLQGIAAKAGGAHDQFSKTAMGELNAGTVWSAPLPPVQEVILRKCWEEKISPWAACLKLRASEEAASYRKMIAALDRLSQGTLGDRKRAAEKVVEIENHMKAWGESPGSTPGKPVRKMDLKKVPKFGWLAEVFGIRGVFRIPDVRFGKSDPSLVFMADWFRPTGKSL
jgi:hypothetical protein